MKSKKSLKNILTNAGMATALTFFSLFNMNYAPAQNIISSEGTNPKIEISKQENPNLKSTAELPSDPQHPMYGLNSYVPAYGIDYQTKTDWYGSGDVNGDGVIDINDYNSSISGTNPFNDGTYRGDTDLNGVSGQSADKAIILEYINGERTHINKWELESETEKRNHFAKAMAIDPTDKVNAYTADWLCGNYSVQTFVNFNGVFDIENSSMAEDNGTNLQLDTKHNGIFRIPLRDVTTVTGPGTTHAVDNVYLGSPENQDATAFENRIYVEPQTDVIQNQGDYSLNDYAKESWYGYNYNSFLQQWGYFSRRLVEYDLNTTPPIMTYKNSGLVISWNPFHDLEYPADKDQEYTPGIENNLETGEINNFIYANETKIKKTFNSNQVNDGSKDQYNYDVNVLWELTAGAYNSQNTLDAIHNQTLRIRDTTPPVYNETTGQWSDSSGSPVSVLEEIVTTGDVCKMDSTITQTAKDVSGNQATYVKEIIGELYTGTPYLISDPHAGDTLRIALETLEIPENVGGWPEYKDDRANFVTNYTIEQIKQENLEWLKKMVFTATNECGNVSPEKVERFYWKPSGTGVDDPVSSLENMVLMSNPIGNNLRIVYMGEGTMKADADIYDLNGRIVQDNSPKDFPKGEIQNYDVSNLPAGLYLLRIQDQYNNKTEIKKTLIKK